MINPNMKFKEVIRIDQDCRSIHGWLAASAKTHRGQRQAFFSDKKSGGRGVPGGRNQLETFQQ
jgi:hypothetical protein